MAKARDIVNQAVSEMTAQLKEIKQGNDDDLGSIASSFDEIAGLADQTATKLQRADQALSGEEDEKLYAEPEDEEPEDEDDQPDGEE